MSEREDRIRIDKWLWAARFFKTRSLAAHAVDGGKVHWNGERVKPAKLLRSGDHLRIRLGPFEYHIEILALSHRRGPAAEAQSLYAESGPSRAQREEITRQLQSEPRNATQQKGRPTKRDRRVLSRTFGS